MIVSSWQQQGPRCSAASTRTRTEASFGTGRSVILDVPVCVCLCVQCGPVLGKEIGRRVALLCGVSEGNLKLGSWNFPILDSPIDLTGVVVEGMH
jgi:hypothetical protein